MSFKPNMRLQLTEKLIEDIRQLRMTQDEFIAGYIAIIKKSNLSQTLAFTADVLYLEDGETGDITGTVSTYFTKNGEFYIKLTSGDIILINFRL